MLRKILKDSSLITLANASNQLFAIFFLPLYTRIFSSTELGIQALIVSSSSLIAQIVCLQINQAVARYFSTTTSNYYKKIIASSGFYYYFLANGVFTILALTLINALHWQFSGTYIQSTLTIAAFSFFTQAIFYYLSLLYRFELKSSKLALIIFLNIILSNSMILFFIFYLFKSIEAIFLGQAISQLILSLVMIFNNRMLLQLKYCSKKILKKLINYSWPLVPASLTFILLQYIDRIIISIFLNLHSLGIYSVVLKLSTGISLFTTGLQTIIGPVLFKNYKSKNAKKDNATLFTNIFIILINIFLIISLFSHDILLLLSTKKYADGYSLIPFILLANIFFFMGTNFSLGIKIAGKNVIYIYANFLALCVNIIVIFAFMHTLKLYGVVFAQLCSSLIYAIVTIMTAQKFYVYKINLKLLFSFLLLPTLLIFFIYETINSEVSLRTIFLKILVACVFALFSFVIIHRSKLNKT